MDRIFILKVISVPIVAAVIFLAGFLPYFVISRKIRITESQTANSVPSSSPLTILSPVMKQFLTLANFFSAGVFLSTCITGVYPDVNTKFDNLMDQHSSIPHYPYAGLSLGLGFFLVWLLEILVHTCVHCRGKHNHGHQLSHHDDIENVVVDEEREEMQQHTMAVPHASDNCESVGHEPHSHMPHSGNLIGSAMLTFALGSHSIIEGIGFGVMDEFNSVLSMLITVLLHEAVCAVSLGVNIASRKTKMRSTIVLLVIFSLLIPVGIGIGLLVDSGLHGNVYGEVVLTVLQGIAAGTFIYVVFMEILPGEMAQNGNAFLRLVVMVIGFVVIAAMHLTHDHSGHSHGGHSHGDHN